MKMDQRVCNLACKQKS
uniref:Uncharacterized protein n=1 Tax=Rhizophora mucronata TaxID=61149 RepID=A0A2P2N929_RHIMU